MWYNTACRQPFLLYGEKLKVLVTGGAGYIGSEFIRQISSNISVKQITVLDNLLSGPWPLKPSAYMYTVEGDIRDQELVQFLVNRADIIVHLAAIVGAPACDLDTDLSDSVNVFGAETVFRAVGGKPIITVSTSSVYGDKENELVTEQTSAMPLSRYGSQKLIAEQLLREHCPNHVLFRPVTAFGITKRVRVDTLPNTFIYKALADGVIDVYQPNVIRPFIHATDFALALQHAMFGRVPWGETYNLGNSNLTMTKGQLAKDICEWTGASYIEVDGSDAEMRNYDISFAKYEKLKLPSFFVQTFRTAVDQFIGYGINTIKEQYATLDTVSNTRAFIERKKSYV